VGFLADGAVTHRAGLETFDDFLNRLDFVNRNRIFGPLEVEEAAQRAELLGLVVDEFGVLLEDVIAAESRGGLE